MMELEDRSAQGRACGNLGNTHYLLGNFNEAITYHNEVFGNFILFRTQCILFEIKTNASYIFVSFPVYE